MFQKFTPEELLNYSFHDEAEHYKEGYWLLRYLMLLFEDPIEVIAFYKGTPLQVAKEASQGEFYVTSTCPVPIISETKIKDLTGK